MTRRKRMRRTMRRSKQFSGGRDSVLRGNSPGMSDLCHIWAPRALSPSSSSFSSSLFGLAEAVVAPFAVVLKSSRGPHGASESTSWARLATLKLSWGRFGYLGTVLGTLVALFGHLELPWRLSWAPSGQPSTI